MWVIVEFLEISNDENEVTEIYGPIGTEKEAIDTCKKWNTLYPKTHYEVYELNDCEE